MSLARVDELQKLCCELRSEKVSNRNKAVDRLNDVLSSLEPEVEAVLSKKHNNMEVTWTEILDSCIDAIIKHSIKLDESQDAKGHSTLKNKTYTYSSVVSKLIDCALDKPEALSKDAILRAFFSGFGNRLVLKYFGVTFIQLLESGIFKSPANINEMKVNEFSRLISFLFEAKCDNDESLKIATIRCISKTIEVGARSTQFYVDLVDHWPDIKEFCMHVRPSDEKAQFEVINLYQLAVLQLSTDFHSTVCEYILDLLPTICGFYKCRMKAEYKEVLFSTCLASIQAMYPILADGDTSTMGVILDESWYKMLRKLVTTVESEIIEKKSVIYGLSGSCSDVFLKMAADVVFLVYWNTNSQTEEDGESSKKRRRLLEKFEHILDMIKQENGNGNSIWFSILNELISKQPLLIDHMNLELLINQMILESNFLQKTPNAIRNVRKCCEIIMIRETTLKKSGTIPDNFCADQWTKLVTTVLAVTTSSNDIIREKQLLIQSLIKSGKVSGSDCVNLIQSYIVTKGMRRNECIQTVREVFLNNDKCCVEKSLELAMKTINWFYLSDGSIDANSMLMSVDPINVELVADTAAVAVINFLKQPVSECRTEKSSATNKILLKYNRRYICLENQRAKENSLQNRANCTKNCLIQQNYEFLMRTVNFNTSQLSSVAAVSADLSNLNVMICLMNCFMRYCVFGEDVQQQCPLIKRIGFFLNQIEYQLKQINVKTAGRSDLQEIVEKLTSVTSGMAQFSVVKTVFDEQNLDGLIEFLRKLIAFWLSDAQEDMETDQGDDSFTLKAVEVLVYLCGCENHFTKTFQIVSNFEYNLKSNVEDVFKFIRIFCTHRPKPAVSNWIVDKLYDISAQLNKDVAVSSKLITLFSEIFIYMKEATNFLDDVLEVYLAYLKKSFKKSYSVEMVERLLPIAKTVAHCQPELLNDENFAKVCFQIAKFISMPSFAIQSAAIDCVTGLMDSTWLFKNQPHSDGYFAFCTELYEYLDVDSILKQAQESKKCEVAIQLFSSLFAFSAFHKKQAFLMLGKLCASCDLGRDDFLKFEELAKYFECTLESLTNPFIDALVSYWIGNQFELEKFPWYLCSNLKEICFKKNISRFAFHILTHNPKDLASLLKISGFQKEDIKLHSQTRCEAFLLPLNAGISINHEDYKTVAKNLLSTTQKLGWKFDSTSNLNFEMIALLVDHCDCQEHFAKYFRFEYEFETDTENVLCSESLKASFNFCATGNVRGNALSHLLESEPKQLLDACAAIKNKIHFSVFVEDKLKHLCRFCCFMELLVDAFNENFKKGNAENIKDFFIRDLVVFFTNLIQQKIVPCHMQRASIHGLWYLMQKIIAKGETALKKYVNIVTRALINVAESDAGGDIRKFSLQCLQFLICDNSRFFGESIGLLDEFPEVDEYKNFREIRKRFIRHAETGLRSDISDFLNDCRRGTEGLKCMKQSIASQKDQLKPLSVEAQSDNLLHKLIKRLISILKSDNTTIAMEAARCLGEIGALKIGNISFYFDTDSSFYEKFANGNALQYFSKCFFEVLDIILLSYNHQTIAYIYEVCDNLVNSKVGGKMLTEYKHFQMFEMGSKQSCFENISLVSAFNLVEILQSTSDKQYEDWICQFTAKIFETFEWTSCQKLAEFDVTFSESSLIPIFKVMIEDKQTHFQAVAKMLEYFFTESNKVLVDESLSGGIFKEKRAIKFFLEICECIRLHNEWTVPINLLYVAKACIYCQAYFMAIMYLEVWALNTDNEEPLSDPIFQDVANKAYFSIGCSDAISGFLSPLNSRFEFLNLESKWSEVLLELDSTNDLANEQFTDSLRRNGLLALVNIVNSKFSGKVDYETCWQLGDWNISTDLASTLSSVTDYENEFQKLHYSALKSLHFKEQLTALSAIASARQCVLSILKEISVECIQSLYKYLTWLQLLQQAEDFCEIQFQTSTNAADILAKWDIGTVLDYGNFSCKHSVLAQRLSLVKSAGVRVTRKIKEFYKEENVIGQYLVDCINECKNADATNLTIRYIAQLKNMDLKPMFKSKVLLEDAENCWKTGKPSMAMSILKELISNKTYGFSLERVTGLRIYGEYKAETNAANFDDIYKDNFRMSSQCLEKLIKYREKISKEMSFEYKNMEQFQVDNQKEAHRSIAKYADKEYTQLNSYINSEAFKTKKKIMDLNKEDAESLKSSRDEEKRKQLLFLRKNDTIDSSEINMVESKHLEYLSLAVDNYISFCKLDDATTSPTVYRLMSLWFSNKNVDELNELVSKGIRSVPSYKFLCVLNQMTAQLHTNVQAFSESIQDVLVRCAQEHPHHALYHLLALCFAKADLKKSTKSDERAEIAKRVVDRSSHKGTLHCIKEMKAMFTALIDFANKSTENMTSLTLSDSMRKLKNLSHIQCPTVTLPISVNGNYEVTSVKKWHDDVGLVGGINAPKKLMCLCSDGRSRPQLLKGKDDMRQDAVMQQVLTMVNNLLQGDRETSEERLFLRTYRVVPLSERSGILEWCENTIPIGLYLTGTKKEKGAHKRYYPNDYDNRKCREVLMQAHIQKKDAATKEKYFVDICKHFHPVLHYFFFEKFLVPGQWFERRLSYINSVASSSMVGYILGLGDRHVQNILIDEITAEVIHIDFGIAFEQGKIMPTPEMVPFRLTRDMVAPMGVCGPDGIFKKSCEKTMSILRKHKGVVMTILEVLLYDPMYIWDVCSKKLLGDEDIDETNLTAQRALLRVQAKLEGKDEGLIGSSSVEVQVQRLINDARSVSNLSCMYPGWSPYL